MTATLHRFARLALVTVSVLSVVGCQAPQTSTPVTERESKAAPALPSQDVVFSVEYYQDMDAALPAGISATPEVFIALPMLSGRFVGSPFDVGLTELIDDYDQVAMDFVGVAERIDQSISSIMHGDQTIGIEIQPAATRFARFGTFAYEPRSGNGLGRTGFIDAEDGDYLWLTYFDRPCTVRGRQPLPDGTYFDYAVDIPRAGLFWLELAASSNGGEVISVAQPSIQPVFGIELPTAQGRRNVL